MGQYFCLASTETGTYAGVNNLAAMLKASEQIWSVAMPAALTALCMTGRRDHPRDLPWVPDGLWAGKMVMMYGDYAENDDIIGRAREIGGPEDAVFTNRVDTPALLDGSARRRKNLKDLSTSLLPIVERALEMRINDMDQDGKTHQSGSWRYVDLIPVEKTSAGWDLPGRNMVPATPDEAARLESDLLYYKRMGALDNTVWQRGPLHVNPKLHFTPRSEVPEIIPAPENGLGSHMLWVSLDRLEFIDPQEVGDVPDVTGIMNGDSARAVMAGITHHETRGGGDIESMGPIDMLCRWRGDRIALVGPEGITLGRKTITQEEIRTRWTNISDAAKAFVDFNDRTGFYRVEATGEPRQALTLAERDIAAIITASVECTAAVKSMPAAVQEHGLHVVISPALRVLAKGREEAEYTLPPSADAFINGGKIFLSAKTRARIQPLLASLPMQEVAITSDTGSNETGYYDQGCQAVLIVKSNHEIIGSMAA